MVERASGAPADDAPAPARWPAGALRLVLFSPGDRPPAATLELVRTCAPRGLGTLIVRERQLDEDALRRLLDGALACCVPRGVTVLVSDRPELARASGAHGVQLGHAGPTAAEARRVFPGGLVSASLHAEQLDTLEPDSLDAMTLSPWRPTHRSRPRPLLDAATVRRTTLRVAPLPVVLLGGITAAGVAEMPDGLAGVAVIRALADARDPGPATAALRAAVDARLDGTAPGSSTGPASRDQEDEP